MEEEIHAPEGSVYVNKTDQSLRAKVFVLGSNDSLDNWELISDIENDTK